MVKLLITVGLIAFGLCSTFQGVSLLKTRQVRRVERSIDKETGAIDRQPVATEEGFKYQLGIISDLDQHSKTKNILGQDEWVSYFLTGNLYLNYKEHGVKDANITIQWEEGKPEVLKSRLNVAGRGMELSELIVYRKELMACDDRSGIVFRLLPSFPEDDKIRWKAVPWVILAGGDGNSSRAFKCEWATEKDGNLWIGSHGTAHDLSYVKEITPSGVVTHHDWRDSYRKMAEAAGVTPPGYIVHEAAGWCNIHKKWVFIPRKISSEGFIYTKDYYKASNKIIIANEDFSDIMLHGLAGELMPSHGVSSFKWLPLAGNENHYIVALKAEEIGDEQATFILAFDMEGNTLFPETKIEDNKYEGLEFL
ncbi:unnamed protein product [Allacma fusca]|uniref:Soluble calcium-activated nucleotidase 1 n=1 Tax=Allacma fusca TaxID=39272 RepID=A0A8J2K4U5_9HEXA|nr:unnamed protein product [Allacma fusca]